LKNQGFIEDTDCVFSSCASKCKIKATTPSIAQCKAKCFLLKKKYEGQSFRAIIR